MKGIGRRAVLAGGAALLATPWIARAAAGEAVEAILAASRLGPLTGFALADLDAEGLLEAHRADAPLPPASVAKVATTLYALEGLGPEFRFRTEIRATGPVEAGVLKGDLVLVGGGDPVLDTDALGELGNALRAGGLGAVEGRLLVATGALPAVAEIDAGQPETAAYNPTISGMNLNFNRVFLAWGPGKSGPALALSAPGARFEVPVKGIRAELVEGGLPRHRFEGAAEVWSLPRAGLGGRGSVWLPVRAPGANAGEVFRRLAAGTGLALPEAEVVPAAKGAVMALRESDPLAPMLRDMLRYSTNLTAEVVGLRASQALGRAPEGLGASGAAMTAWVRARFGVGGAVYVNHSGLSDDTRLAAGEQVAMLRQAAGGALPGLLRLRPILDAQRRPFEMPGVAVVAKTGTMDFVSALAGYMTGRRRLAFAIFAADPAARARIRPEERAKPPGAAAWAARARGQEQALLRRWATLHA
ncbi:MAG TPA: D-alanyl-D-alanine carboxypeptidase/D-alanyl-D-alanine-endopeptidase [Amaricoccus sp.]|nr:D-alanyl-D-alanine carboxypeptidase/D-alanyl-D-alanine-endopeptidase [Amaricoccus sp.]